MSLFATFMPIFFAGTVGISNFSFPAGSASDSVFNHPLNVLRINLAENDAEKVKVKIGILLSAIEKAKNEDYQEQVFEELQSSVQDIMVSIAGVENKLIAGDIDRSQVTVLLLDTQMLLSKYQDYLEATSARTSGDGVKSTLRLIRERTNALSHLIKSDQEDLKDDGVLNGSIISAIRVTIAGKLSRDGSILNTEKDKKYHIVASPYALSDTIVATDMTVDGVVVMGNPNQLIAFEIEPGKEEQKDLSEEVEGRVTTFGEEYILLNEDGVFLLSSDSVDFKTYAGKKVVVKGILLEDTIFISQESDIQVATSDINPFQKSANIP